MFVSERVLDDVGDDDVAGRSRSAVREQVEVLLLRVGLFASLGFIAAICFM